jgi:hypothetical protein
MEAARNALSLGLTHQQISKISGLSEDEIEQIAAKAVCPLT